MMRLPDLPEDHPEYGGYVTTLRTIAKIYELGKRYLLFAKRSDAAKRGWATRRANAAQRAVS